MQASLKQLIFKGQACRIPYASNLFRPLVAAHRENTLEGFQTALYEGSDFVELDVVMTKDEEVLVLHDPYLSRLTNVDQLPQFIERKRTRLLHGKEKCDWWAIDFTLQELKQLKINQSILADQRINVFNGLFTFPTLKEVIQNIKNFNQKFAGRNNSDKRPGGILLEIKDYEVDIISQGQFHKSYQNLNISERVLRILEEENIDQSNESSNQCPIVLMSFDEDALIYFNLKTDLPKIYLVWKFEQIPNLKKIKTYADGIGIDLKMLWDKERDQPQQIVFDIKNHGFLLYSWTVQDDNEKKMNWMNSHHSVDLYFKLMNGLSLDAIITEYLQFKRLRFPEKAMNVLQILRSDYKPPVLTIKPTKTEVQRRRKHSH